MSFYGRLVHEILAGGPTGARRAAPVLRRYGEAVRWLKPIPSAPNSSPMTPPLNSHRAAPVSDLRDRIYAVLFNSPWLYQCDSCLAVDTFSRRLLVNQHTRRLAHSGFLHREKRRCAICGKHRVVSIDSSRPC